MIGAGSAAWLDLWERGAPEPPHLRRRELLASSGLLGGRSTEDLPIGTANADLLRLHRAMFGTRLSCHTACPGCGTALELDLDTDELLAREPSPQPLTSGQPTEPMQLQIGEWEVIFRLPTEGDIDAVRGERDLLAARDALFQRCVTRCRHGAEDTRIALAPPEVIAQVGARMEERDPLATLDFELRCASCGHVWSSTLEVDVFLWTRLDAWAQRLLRDVHALAKVYGWSERAIAQMSPYKRQIYLDMVAG